MNIQKITFANGCFWCTEAIFQHIKGVISVASGYTGGHTVNPTYMEISNGKTGHTEAIEVEYDADELSFDELLLIFFKTHNPTLLNRQGGDVGTQYRSAIFYNTEEQKQQADAIIKKLTNEQVFDRPIVTEVSPLSEFYKAEDHLQNYYNDNNLKPYCALVIQPKLNKFVKEFTDKIKPELL
ncbi:MULTISPECIES: peptide-methionine (S)-S-oxide reductase MsrA [unclassified Mucilaginibacter]|uniref:peptide-methionine (S)-S-oxide reductase MsrA n=1 Tax=unclassified Mucilaginibacter TaxID=2617802 RepID=UPI002AC8B93F|nr:MULTISPECIES: peptide-methionine (S)-S-oxide reductase MsrA [unclassified Mucilaginibacter]MEB0262458.1 peptide-methionine (S)-S-oxide reductase MsrA [Mucilaginibacter sp. 10I4]MEB0279283.1 peptide-methionine (S)-S-oxide reductase MsrA [Mucilaginibacter sp. 10B2]MEB0302579.1 peptide-methionine (S)-S-oxide reductase MsrA [Mucilaginibacter sp. 5C4]WPX23205.1 peptide-methionine (S)-S-oxide reductase MsrA [Mucilaginibacter sp. 5C4]